MVGYLTQTMSKLSTSKSNPPLAVALGEAQTLLTAQAQDRAKPRRFIRWPWGQLARWVDRLVRADQRLAAAYQAAQRAEHFAKPTVDKIAGAQVYGSGEAFRAGFGTCGGLLRGLSHIQWGYDYFAPLIEVGVKNFHFQAIRWSTHGSADSYRAPDPGTLYYLENWDKLFDEFDRAGATAVPQLQPLAWTGLPRWMKTKYADSLLQYEYEQAGVDGKVITQKAEHFVWMSPEIWGSVPSVQQGFADFCRGIVQQLGRHKSIIGWAVMNETGASAGSQMAYKHFSVQAFHKYLTQKYQTIEDLNEAWNSHYASFEEVPVEPPDENESEEAVLELDGTWRFAIDPDERGKEQGWERPDLDDSQWLDIQVPGYWEKQFGQYKEYDGYAWYRRSVAIPSDWAGKVIRFQCAGIDDDAEVFVNGTLVARNVGFNVPVNVEISGCINPGVENLIAIRVNDTFVDGGIYKSVTLTAQGTATPPPRFTQPQRQLDREMFAQEIQAGMCAYQSRVVHEADPQRPAFMKEWVLKTPVENPSTQLDSFIAAPAHFGAVGCDMYKSMGWYPMAIDLLRSTGQGKPIWLMETHYYSPVRDAPESLLQWTWSMAVRGLRSVYFWGVEVGSEHEGAVNDTGVAMAQMQHHFDALAPVLSARRKVQTAIYLPRDSEYLCDRDHIDSVWQQLWRLLNAINVPVDFIDDGQIAEGILDEYTCLLIPLAPYLPEATAGRVAAFVKAGGSVVMWAGSAVYDYQGSVQLEAPGWGLTDLFGARVLPKVPETAQLELRGPLSAEVIRCDSGTFTHRLALDRAVSLLDDGTGRVGISLNRVGEGRALLVAFDIGQLFGRADQRPRLAIARTVWGMLGRCGVNHALYCYESNCEAHLLERGSTAWLVLINHNGEEQTMTVTTRPASDRRLETVYDALTLDKTVLERTAVGQRGQYVVPAYGVRIIKVAG